MARRRGGRRHADRPAPVAGGGRRVPPPPRRGPAGGGRGGGGGAAERGEAAAGRYLRAVREGLMCFRRKLDTTEALVEEARRAGLAVERFRLDLSSNATVEACGNDLEETRADERISLPSVVFDGEHGAYALRGYDELRAAAVAAGAEPVGGAPPGG